MRKENSAAYVKAIMPLQISADSELPKLSLLDYRHLVRHVLDKRRHERRNSIVILETACPSELPIQTQTRRPQRSSRRAR
jgi:hypothetical protein